MLTNFISKVACRVEISGTVESIYASVRKCDFGFVVFDKVYNEHFFEEMSYGAVMFWHCINWREFNVFNYGKTRLF